MPLPKLMLDVPQEGYSFDDGEGVLRAKLSSGLSRVRLDQLDAPLEADLSLILTPSQYQYWKAFCRTAIGPRAVEPFLLDLVVDSPEIEEREVRIIPGTMQTNIQGTAHIVQMRLEVKANPAGASQADDEAFLLFYGLYGDYGDSILNALDHLVNVKFPDALGPP